MENIIKSLINNNENGETIIEIVSEISETTLMLPQSYELPENVVQYRQLMFFYEAGIELVTAKLQILNKEFQCCNDRNPIEGIKSRIKSYSSIVQKLNHMGLPLTVDNMVNHLHDVAGIRVVCPFISDVYHVAGMLLKQNDIEIIKIKDYIQIPKSNGYRSLHLIIMVEVFFSDQKRKVPVEIQLRTIAMDFWAALEHQLKYKKQHFLTTKMQEELKVCADLVADADTRMQKLAEQLPGFVDINI